MQMSQGSRGWSRVGAISGASGQLPGGRDPGGWLGLEAEFLVEIQWGPPGGCAWEEMDRWAFGPRC